MRDKWETSGRQVGVKWETSERQVRDKWQTSGRQVGNKSDTSKKSKCETTGRQVGDKWETSWRQGVSGSERCGARLRAKSMQNQFRKVEKRKVEKWEGFVLNFEKSKNRKVRRGIPTGDKIEYCTLSGDKIEYLKNPKNTGSSTHKIEYSEIKNNQKIEYSGGHSKRHILSFGRSV